MINWWAITTIGIWFAGAYSSKYTKDCSGLFISLVGSMLLGFLWFITTLP